uniref:Uncharacterized protein n=1 Tax=Cucumis melo TaxID=3656 RepID=A0A9I9E768_CUCME
MGTCDMWVCLEMEQKHTPNTLNRAELTQVQVISSASLFTAVPFSYPIRFLMRRMVDFFADDKFIKRYGLSIAGVNENNIDNGDGANKYETASVLFEYPILEKVYPKLTWVKASLTARLPKESGVPESY